MKELVNSDKYSTKITCSLSRVEKIIILREKEYRSSGEYEKAVNDELKRIDCVEGLKEKMTKQRYN